MKRISSTLASIPSILLIFLSFTPLMAAEPSPCNITLGVNTGANKVYQALIDKEGNTYLAGAAQSALFSVPKTDTSFGGFVAKFGPNCAFIWGTQLNTGGANISIKSLDLNGNYVYAAGETTGAVAGVAVPDGRDGFVAKLSTAAGALQAGWPKIISAATTGASSAVTISGIKFDRKNIAHIIGNTNNGVSFGNVSASKIGGVDGFIIDMKVNGDSAGPIAALGAAGTVIVMPTSLAIDPSNNIYLSGSTSANVFKKDIVGTMDGFLAKYRLYPTKKLLWANSMGTANAVTSSTGVILSSKGGMGFLAGYSTAQVSSFSGSRRGYVAAFNLANGAYKWTNYSPIADGRDENIAIAADPQGNAVAVGYTTNAYAHTNTFADATIIKYSPKGARIWSAVLGDNTTASNAAYWSVVAFQKKIIAAGSSSFGTDPFHPAPDQQGTFAISKTYQPCSCNEQEIAKGLIAWCD